MRVDSLSDDVPHKIPHTKKWLELTHNVKKRVSEELKDGDDKVKEWLTEQIYVIEQMKHLLTYPFNKEKYTKNEIKIYGRYYVIETGEVLIYNIECVICSRSAYVPVPSWNDNFLRIHVNQHLLKLDKE